LWPLFLFSGVKVSIFVKKYMLTKVQIIPHRKRGNVGITGHYNDRSTGRNVYLLADGRRIVTAVGEGDRLFQHSFEKGAPLEFTVNLETYEDKAVVDFWKNHPLVETAGYTNRNLAMPSFTFEIREDRVNVDYEALVSKLQCVKTVSQMSLRERRDLCFALGSDPREMSDKELYIHLIGLTFDGIAIAQRAEVTRFGIVRNAERLATVYANKAVTYGIINRDGSVYRVGGRNLGGSIDSVIATLLADEEFFENYIQVEVDRLDKDELAQAADLEDPLLNGLPEGVRELLPVMSSIEKKAAAKSSKGKSE